MADFDQASYVPQEGDVYIQEVRSGRFTLHRFDGESWEQLGAGYNKEDIEGLVSVMHFLFESKGMRSYYQPAFKYHMKEKE